MTQITVTWKASKELQKREYAETGEKPDAHRKFTLDLKELSQKDREPLIKHLGLHCFVLGMETGHVFSEWWPGTYLAPRSLTFDSRPTVDGILLCVTSEAVARSAAGAHKAKVDAKKKATRKLLQGHYDNTRQEIDALVESGDLADLEEFRFPVRSVADFRPDSGSSRITLAKLLVDAIKAAHKAKRQGDKADWIAAYGSGYLKRVYTMGYDAQRLYVTERAAAEAPGFVVDFDEGAKWKDRTCPSLEALDSEAEAEKLGIGEEVKVVWLVNPAANRVQGKEEDYYVFDAVEAVVIRNYLGQLYDLVMEL